jgi:arabinofuranosyltransferase
LSPSVNKLWIPICLALAATGFFLYPWWTVDDAWIAYRYGKNLVEAGELNWNPGQDPVEGYTGVFLPLLAAVFIQFGISVVVGVKVFCVLMWGVSLFFLRNILRRTGTSSFSSGVVLIAFSVSPLTFMHSLSGLETTVFMMGLLATIDAMLHWHQTGEIKAIYKLGLWSLFICFVRPEGMIIGGAACTIAFFSRSERQIKHLLLLAFLFAIPFLIYFLWRWNYYGQFLPNTFYAKRASEGFSLESIKMFVRFLGDYWLATVAIVIASRWFPGNETPKAGRKIFVIFSVAVVIPVFCVYLSSHLWMNYGARFFAPFAPLAFPFAGWSIDRMREGAARGHRAQAVSLLLILLATLQAFTYVSRYREDLAFIRDYQPIVDEELIPLGKLLKSKMPPGQWLVSYQDAGAIPYYSELPTVDFGHLNDEILHNPRMTQPEKVDYFFSKNPGGVVFTSYSIDSVLYIEEAHAILSDARFDNYVLFAKFPTQTDFNYFQFLYLRKDLVRYF